MSGYVDERIETPKSFTIVIDSNKRISGDTNNCIIQINTPHVYQKMNCEIYLFSLSFDNGNPIQASYVKLVSRNLSVYEQYSNASNKILSIYDNRNYRYSRQTFECDNIDGRHLEFQLLDENDNLLKDSLDAPYNSPWILIMKCTSIN